MRMRVALGLALVVLVSAPFSRAASSPEQKCAVAKLKAATKKANAELKCQKKALATGQSVDPACLAKAQARFAQAFANAEARGGCKNAGDAPAVQDTVELFVDDVVTAVGPPKSLSADVQPIFTGNCTSCHTGVTAPKGLDLSAGNAFAKLVDVPSVEDPEVNRVLPGNPNQSYLFWKITDNDGIGLTEPMPLGGYPMSQRNIRMIQRWIEQGAPDN